MWPFRKKCDELMELSIIQHTNDLMRIAELERKAVERKAVMLSDSRRLANEVIDRFCDHSVRQQAKRWLDHRLSL